MTDKAHLFIFIKDGVVMSKLIVEGGRRLQGEVRLQGAKNSVLPVLAATLLVKGVSVIHNCPDLSDVDVALKILSFLGCKCSREGRSVTVDATDIVCDRIPDELMREMRSSVMFLGAILSRCKSAVISSPGGCELGPRPIDLHLRALVDLGYDIDDKNGYIICSKQNRDSKGSVNLPFPSVGATENSILASVLNPDITVITGAAKEPEIVDLADFLNSAGAKIRGAGTDTIEIKGVESLHSVEHTIIPDRIVAATYMSAAAVTGGDITIHGAKSKHLKAVINSFNEMGCEISSGVDFLRIKSIDRPKAVHLTKTMVYPGFPTDAGPLLATALSIAKGCSVLVETIFENRFRYMDELARLGAKFRIQNRVAVIEGVEALKGARVSCTDLRGGAALVVAGLCANGITEIDQTFHIERGYEKIEKEFSALGAKIYYKGCNG